MSYMKRLNEKVDYERAFNILMCYWDSLPDEHKDRINEQLKEVGL